ncbi:MAG: rod shape-determining protein MreD [bacterium]
MQKFLLTLFIAIVFVLQVCFVSGLKFMGIQGELLLILCLFWAYRRGTEEGMLMGLLCGFLVDISSSGLFIHSISYPLTCFFVGAVRESLLGGGTLMVMSISFFGTITSHLIELLLLYFYKKSWGALGPAIFISAMMNALLTFVILPFYKQAVKDPDTGRLSYY